MLSHPTPLASSPRSLNVDVAGEIGAVALRLQPAIEAIRGWETEISTDLEAFKLHENTVEYQEGEHASIRGPLPPRGPATGLVIWRNHIVGQWGVPERLDTAFSVTKSALATLAAVALADGRIDLEQPVSQRLDIAEFREPANRAITWRHLLTLTSEWRGSLWGIPDSIDWNRTVPKILGGPLKGTFRQIHPPGHHWEFNDVRVNLLSLALTHLFGKNLAAVFACRVMDPIGASTTWSWHGYRGAEIPLAGRATPVVAGGAHWGGGLIVSALDLARLGLLYARRGEWEGRTVLPEYVFDLIRIPSPQNRNFGLMWWVNTAQLIPSLSAAAIWGSGIANFLVVDPSRELVIVMRWFDVRRRDEIIGRIVAAVAGTER